MYVEVMPKILIAAPISDKKEYCLDRWINHIKGLSYINADILLVDNSHDELFHTAIRKRHAVEVLHVPPGNDTAPAFIAKCQNVIRQRVIDGEYDNLMSIECDVFTPPNIIEHLLAWNALVVSAPYLIMEQEKTTLCVLDCERQYRSKRTRKLTSEEGFEMFDGNIKTIFSGGIGCTLIHNSVLQKIQFRIDAKHEKGAFSDSFFGWDLKRANIDQYLDTGLIVEHDRRSWRSNYDYSKR